MAPEPIDLGIEDLADAVEVGAGGFGTVYKARQESLRRDVAVKMVTSTVKDRKVRIRFEREIQAMGMLSGHPNIVTVYDSGFTSNGQPYILMDFMDQGSLADRLESDTTLPWADVLEIMVKVCGALETAHQAGILHRDIKPENVLVSAYGEPKLGDFGIARLKGGPETGTSSLTASIEHVSPELLEAKAPGVPSDIYALGSTMYKLLVGRAAFLKPEDESIVPALTRIRDEPVPNLRERGVPDPVAAIVERSMAKDPEARFASAAEMGRALRTAQRQLGLSVTPLPIREEEAAAARDATRTINTDDLASSIDDIRAQAAQSSGPVTHSGPQGVPGPPTQSGPHNLPVGPQGPQPAPPRQPTGPVGYPQQPQHPTGPQPFRGPGPSPAYQQPAPPSSGGGRTLAIIGGIVGLAVVVGIVVAVSVSGGGSPDPEPTPSVTPTAPVTEPEPGPTTEDEPADYVFETLMDDTGTIQISAPRPWTDIDGSAWVEDGSPIGRQIVAAPDLAGFRGSWNVPGLIFGVSEQLATSFTPETLLDAFSFATQCDYQGRSPYSDPAYTGFRDDYVDCGGTDTDYTIVAAWPPTSDVMLLVQFQHLDDRDEVALQMALDTFVIIPPQTENPGQ
ncbi:serine/threonine-protein kinase [Euzebya rosea]|uniref:serine/threonine-protein kinase n=1 Tax=Euzebya rosea TaxID=2052804 RepID=UPI000D3E712C|nr:serine/threonine-protein kinase [Euzebya rosea]